MKKKKRKKKNKKEKKEQKRYIYINIELYAFSLSLSLTLSFSLFLSRTSTHTNFRVTSRSLAATYIIFFLYFFFPLVPSPPQCTFDKMYVRSRWKTSGGPGACTNPRVYIIIFIWKCTCFVCGPGRYRFRPARTMVSGGVPEETAAETVYPLLSRTKRFSCQRSSLPVNCALKR